MVVRVDEAQLADRDEMTRFAAALQEGTGEDWPLVVVIAGLRSIRDHRRMPSYFERAEWHELGSLDEEATLEALVKPAATASRPFASAAAALLAAETGGYLYAIQLYGHHAWRAIRGKVLVRSGAPLPGVELAVLGHPEFGRTRSRADGAFDIAVNGGGPLTVVYERDGYLPSQRQLEVPWQDYAVADDVVLVELDTQVSAASPASAQDFEVAQGSEPTDGDSDRRCAKC